MKYKILLLCLLVMVSCTPKKAKPTTQFNKWKNVSSWSFVGKMAVNTGQENGSGKVEWLVSQDESRAKFRAPLGQGSWEVIEDKNKAQLISSRNGETTADNAEELIAGELGWYFPWDDLHYWLRGFTPDDELIVHKDLPATLNYDGWQITYSKWMMTPIGWLPKKIKASKPPYSVKLIIYQWNIK